MVLNHEYGKNLGKYEKQVIEVSEVLRGIYWTKNKLFLGAKAFYSDPIDDIYWTLVEQFTIDSKREIEKLVKEVEPFFKKHKKHFSFYLTPYDRRRNVDKYLKELGYKITAKDNFMFLEKGHLKRRDLSLQSGVTLKEIKTDKDNEIYIDCYTRAYTSNPEDAYFLQMPS